MMTITGQQARQFILAKQGLIGSYRVPDRKEHILVVKGLWWEPDIRVTKKLKAALERTLREFGRFNDCKSVE
ncbi:MAG: hypothetical protein K6A74_04605 [Lachnospiraceae bacterium]|nr:hypothetical protein [Lachnospiraceae bacterium]